jgi:transposase
MCMKLSSTRLSHPLKRGRKVSKTKRGKGTKIMAVADRGGLPVSLCIESGTPHEVTLANSTLLQMVVPDAPQNLIDDNAYDSDRLDAELSIFGIQVIASHRLNRKNPTQDGRRLRRYRRRWKIERLFAWLQNFRRLVVRYERRAENFLGNALPSRVVNSAWAFMRYVVVSGPHEPPATPKERGPESSVRRAAPCNLLLQHDNLLNCTWLQSESPSNIEPRFFHCFAKQRIKPFRLLVNDCEQLNALDGLQPRNCK